MSSKKSRVCFIHHLIGILFLHLLLPQALSKTLTMDERFYFKEQFALLQPSKNGTISLENIKEVPFSTIFKKFLWFLFSDVKMMYTIVSVIFQALMKNATDAMKESRAHEILTSVSAFCILWRISF